MLGTIVHSGNIVFMIICLELVLLSLSLTPFFLLITWLFEYLIIGFGVYVYGLAGSVAEGVELARKVLYSGEAIRTLDRWIAVTQKLMPWFSLLCIC